MIKNPIIKGFRPDPNIIRVEDDYYIVTSTFQWYPGIEIHHSRDLENWALLDRPLKEARLLEMKGEQAGCGVWAPNITYHDGEFYIVYSDCKTFGSVHNYLITASSINGPWSDPVYLCSGAFDLSLFHEGDKKHLLMCEHDGRVMANMANIVGFLPSLKGIKAIADGVRSKHTNVLYPFKGIAMVEYDHKDKKIVGERKIVFKGTKLGSTEGPNLYKKGNYYYLITAEGGTGYGHAVSLARSESLYGPYEVHPDNPILTSRSKKDVFQRVGHGSIVETKNGETFMAFLCSRPLKYKKGSILGRESGLIKMEWKNDWLYADYDSVEVCTEGERTRLYEFDESLPEDFQWLRSEHNRQWLRVEDNKLKIVGKEWIDSPFDQGLAAVRMMSHAFEAETVMTFEPDNHHQTAGMAAYYSTGLYYYLSFGQQGEITLRQCINGLEKVVCKEQTDRKSVKIKMLVKNHTIQFFIAEKDKYRPIYKPVKIYFMSDETSKPYGFTGSFIALCCQDLSGMEKEASFDYLSIKGV